MNRGFTLVEVVVALALFAFVGLAGGALLESAARSAREAESRERLLWAASTILDSLRSQDRWSVGERTLPGGDRVRWSRDSTGGVIEVWTRRASRPWLVVPVISGGHSANAVGAPDE
jgi:prepilin-type N-terminal cleavage/methylation domain-containing protein